MTGIRPEHMQSMWDLNEECDRLRFERGYYTVALRSFHAMPRSLRSRWHGGNVLTRGAFESPDQAHVWAHSKGLAVMSYTVVGVGGKSAG